MISKKYVGDEWPLSESTPKTPPDEACATIELSAGMSLRDYFAGQALMLIAWEDREYSVEPSPDTAIARHAYAIADAMLAERAK